MSAPIPHREPEGAGVICPVGRRVIDPCPRKRATGRYHECQECLDDWR